jgi:hypothetical protein
MAEVHKLSIEAFEWIIGEIEAKFQQAQVCWHSYWFLYYLYLCTGLD